MTISVAIIVKNEESVIRRCLEGASAFADEIVVLDTGSTDRTIEIALEHPKVRMFRSQRFTPDTPVSDFDFSIARNQSIEECNGEWVVWWDADDTIDQATADAIRMLGNNTPPDRVFAFSVRSQGVVFEQPRMLPKESNVRFDEGHACHEYLECRGTPMESRRDIVISHEPEGGSTSSVQRNIAILEADYFRKNRHDQRTMFYLASAYREASRLTEAVDFYGKYLDVSKWAEERMFARYYMATCLGELDRKDEAIAECHRAMSEDGRFAEPYCLIGDILLSMGRKEQAKLWFQMASTMSVPEDAILFVNPSCYSEYPTSKMQEADTLSRIEEPQLEPTQETPTMVLRLPQERGLSVLGLCAVDNCAAIHQSHSFEVVCTDDWQRDLLSLASRVSPSSEKNAVELELPQEMHGRHAVEWYCRSAGFVMSQWNPLHVDRGNGNHIFLDLNGIEDIGDIKNALGEIGPIVGPGIGFKADLDSISSAKVVIGCSSGWAHHVAAFAGIPCAVVWLDGCADECGWPNQANIVPDEGGLSQDRLIQEVRRITNG